MTLILTLSIIGLMAAVFLIITKPGHDRREKEFNEVLARYIAYLEAAARPSTYTKRLKAAQRHHGEEDVPADRD